MEPQVREERPDHHGENFGVQGRGAFYDQTGTMRDVVQNHLFQARNLAMEGARAHRQRVDPRREGEGAEGDGRAAPADLVRGQFRGYTSEPGVFDSKVETFAAVKLHVDNWRCRTCRSGPRAYKNLPVTCTEVLVCLKHPPKIFPTYRAYEPPGNRESDVVIALGTTVMDLSEKNIGLQVEPTMSHPGADEPEAYERVLTDAMAGDRTLFARQDYVEEACASSTRCSRRIRRCIRTIRASGARPSAAAGPEASWDDPAAP
ncbi:MAG: hypothetical protein U1F10_04250 [Burkholderiales bacterium]